MGMSIGEISISMGRVVVETYFSRLKMILGEMVRGKNFENVVRYVMGMLILLSNFIFCLCVISHNMR